MYFKKGQIVVTRGINNAMCDSADFTKEVMKCFARYNNNDWGEMCDEDKAMNDRALKYNDDRIFASYNTSKGKVYIITEYDRSVTTILFSDEY